MNRPFRSGGAAQEGRRKNKYGIEISAIFCYTILWRRTLPHPTRLFPIYIEGEPMNDINIALIEPEIPQNTGNTART